MIRVLFQNCFFLNPPDQTLETTTTNTPTSTSYVTETTTLPVQLLEDFYASSEEFPQDLSYSIEGRNFGYGQRVH